MNKIYIRGNEIATKEYVDSLSFEGGNVDLSNYYTKEEIDDYGLYVLKDLKICSSSFSGGSSYLNWVDTDENKCAQISAIFNQAVFNHDFRPVLAISDRNDPNEYATSFSGIIHPAFSRSDLRSKRTSYWYKGIKHNRSGNSYTMFNDCISLESVGLEVIGEWQEDGSFKCTSYALLLSSQTLAQSEWTNSNFLKKTNTTSYTPTANYHPATKLYVDTTIQNVIKEQPTTQDLIDEGFDYFEGNQIIHCNYTVTNLSDTYQFVLNENGYYESNNKGVNNSYALCRVDFNNDTDIALTIDYISSGEANFDFGIFSKIDSHLSNNSNEDSGDIIEKSCKGESSTDIKQIVYNIPAGEHFIEIKYRKDSSGNKDNDSLQFKIPEDQIIPIYKNQQLATKEYVNNAITNGGTSETDLSNYYTKEEINNIIAEANNSTQVEEMPEASADNKGTIVQYIGDTNNTYTTGYFYQVVEETIINEDGTETIIYKWEEIKSPEINLEDYATKKYVDDTIATSIAGISTTSMEIATSLPTENISTSTIYLVKDETASTDTENIYNEYIYINGAWENIGSTKTAVDLSKYSTTEELSQMLSTTLRNYSTIADMNAALSSYYTKTATDEAIENAINNIEHPTTDLSNYYNKQEIDTMIGDINSILDTINGEEV